MYDKHISMEHIRKKNSFLFSFLAIQIHIILPIMVIWFNATQNNVDNTLYYVFDDYHKSCHLLGFIIFKFYM